MTRIGKMRGYGPKMPYYDYEKIFCRIAEVADCFEELVDSRLRGYVHEYEPRVFKDCKDIPDLENKIGQVLFDIYDVSKAKNSLEIDIEDINIAAKISDQRQPDISRGPRPAPLALREGAQRAFEEIEARNRQQAEEDYEARLRYLQKEKVQKKRARVQKQKQELTANRETRVDEVFKGKLKQKTAIQIPEGVFVEMMAEEPHAAQAEADPFLVEETVSESDCQQEEVIEEKKVGKEARFEDWADDIMAFDSDAEETRPPLAVKTPGSLSPAEPVLPTWNECLAKLTVAQALWQEEDRMLVKRPPQLKMDEEGEEGVQLVPNYLSRPLPKISGYQRQPAFKLWIEEHDKMIAEGRIPSRESFIWAGLTRRRCHQEDDMAYYGQKDGKEWDRLYGANLNYIYAEGVLRNPDVPAEPWQRTKDFRERLLTKQFPQFEKARENKVKAIKDKKRSYMEEFRRNETLEQEEKRQKADRLRAQKNYEKNKRMPVRSKRSPSEQREARREAKRLAAEKRRRAEKAKDSAQEE